MTDDCAYRLTSFEPIVECLMRCEYHADGWELVIRHRHYAGHFGECPVHSYGRLTLYELLEVLECEANGWGPLSGAETHRGGL